MPDATAPSDPRHANAPSTDDWRNPARMRREWAGAFASLPLETPATSVWPGIALRIDDRQRRRWRARWAIAAVIALIALVPLRRWAVDPVASDASVAATSGATTPDTDAMRHRTMPRASADGSSSTALEPLYAESARLEAVLAIARDDRVASGPAAALSGELDARLASIDAALSQPTLPQAQRLGLWRRRVDALRQTAGFESTQRWLAINGDRYDGALVSVD